MDVALQPRAPEHGLGRIHPKTAAGHGCIALLLLSTVKNGGITAYPHGRAGIVRNPQAAQHQRQRQMEKTGAGREHGR